MPKKIKINVEDHKLIDNKRTCEDVTQVVLPSFEHPTTAVENVSGMAMNLDVPNPSRFNSAEMSIAHNNGVNCEYLDMPGKHESEFRMARQTFDTSKTDIKHEGVKFRTVSLFKRVEKGTIETGNPWGSTCVYGIVRYEEIVDGKQTFLVDATGNKLVVNGKSFTDDISSLLN